VRIDLVNDEVSDTSRGDGQLPRLAPSPRLPSAAGCEKDLTVKTIPSPRRPGIQLEAGHKVSAGKKENIVVSDNYRSQSR
jgi:hypothetical protein